MKTRLLVLAAVLTCCGSTPTGDDGSCFLPLEQHCGAFPCPSYEQSLVELRLFGAASSCFVAQSGRCGGDLRFTRSGQGFGSTTLYFDEGGVVVAVYATTDAGDARSACPFWKHYGRRVSCAEVVLENYCRR